MHFQAFPKHWMAKGSLVPFWHVAGCREEILIPFCVAMHDISKNKGYLIPPNNPEVSDLTKPQREIFTAHATSAV